MDEPRVDPIHEQIREDLGPYAFGTLDTAAAARVAAHLPSCPDCSAALRDYQAIVRLLPTELPLAQPPADARARLLQRVRGIERPVSSRRSRFIRLGHRSSRLPLALSAVFLLILTGAGISLSEEFGPGRLPYRRTYDMWGSDAAPQAAGLLVYQSGGVKLVVAGMPDLAPGRTYQLWFVTGDDDQVSVAVFTVDERGTATIPFELPAAAQPYLGCGVTEEPAGGSDWPTGDDVLVGPQWPGSG